MATTPSTEAEAAEQILTFKGWPPRDFVGDTAISSDMKLYAGIYHPELAFLPVGDDFTMGPEVGRVRGRMLGVKEIIPMHHGTFPALTGTRNSSRRSSREVESRSGNYRQGSPRRW